MGYLFGHADVDDFNGSLVSAWPTNNNLVDYRGTNDGVNDGTGDVAGKHDRARSFDGASKIDVPHHASIATLTALSLFGWFNVTAIGVNQTLVGKHDSNAKRSYIMFVRPDGSVRALVSSDGSNSAAATSMSTTPAAAVSVGTWQLFGFTFSLVDKTVRIYVAGADVGVVVRQNAASIASFADVQLAIGANYSLGVGSNFFTGSGGDCSFWDAVINQAAVTALWNVTKGRFYHVAPQTQIF